MQRHFILLLSFLFALLTHQKASAYYDPSTGRFLSPDPAGHSASMSLYDYAQSDPVNFMDPDGRLVQRLFTADYSFGNQSNYPRTPELDYFTNPFAEPPPPHSPELFSDFLSRQWDHYGPYLNPDRYDLVNIRYGYVLDKSEAMGSLGAFQLGIENKIVTGYILDRNSLNQYLSNGSSPSMLITALRNGEIGRGYTSFSGLGQAGLGVGYNGASVGILGRAGVQTVGNLNDRFTWKQGPEGSTAFVFGWKAKAGPVSLSGSAREFNTDFSLTLGIGNHELGAGFTHHEGPIQYRPFGEVENFDLLPGP